MDSESVWQVVGQTGWQPPVAQLEESVVGAAIVHQGAQPIIAQQFDQDVLGDAGGILSNFVQSGQIWALLVGFVLGYMLRSVTTY